MSQFNPKEVFHNTAYSVQLPYIAGHSPLSTIYCLDFLPSKDVIIKTRKALRAATPFETGKEFFFRNIYMYN